MDYGDLTTIEFRFIMNASIAEYRGILYALLEF